MARLRTVDREAIEALPARLRRAFLLHYYAGFGARGVAVPAIGG